MPDYPMDALDQDYDTAMRRLGARLPVTTHAFRMKAFDAAMLEALQDGARQVVILGAGFDGRGYRLQSSLGGAQFMEVDCGPAQGSSSKICIASVRGTR